MTIKLEHGKWYQLNNGGVWQCDRGEGYIYGINGYWYSSAGAWANYDHDHPLSVSHEVFPYTIQNLNVKAGDVVKCVRWDGDMFRIGVNYTVNKHGSLLYHTTAIDAGLFIVVSRAATKPRTWGELTEAEQNAIAGHHARGGDVEFKTVFNEWVTLKHVGWRNGYTYRIKPSTVVKDVTINVKPNKHGEWVSDVSRTGKHTITFQTIDGKPNWDTIKGVDVGCA